MNSYHGNLGLNLVVYPLRHNVDRACHKIVLLKGDEHEIFIHGLLFFMLSSLALSNAQAEHTPQVRKCLQEERFRSFRDVQKLFAGDFLDRQRTFEQETTSDSHSHQSLDIKPTSAGQPAVRLPDGLHFPHDTIHLFYLLPRYI